MGDKDQTEELKNAEREEAKWVFVCKKPPTACQSRLQERLTICQQLRCHDQQGTINKMRAVVGEIFAGGIFGDVVYAS